MIDKILKMLSFLSLLFLVFMAGSATTEFRVFPYQLLEKPYMGFWAKMFVAEHGKVSIFVWPVSEETIGKSGVTVYDKDKAYDGVTLYASTDGDKAVLIDMDGTILHTWEMPFRKAWPEPTHIKDPVADDLIVWRGLHLYPNGDLLVVYNALMTLPAGYGMVKLDKDSNIIWKYEGYAHHDVSVGPDNNIYTLTQYNRLEPLDSVPHLTPPFMEEYVTILNPDGKEIKSISIFDAFKNSDKYSHVLKYIGQVPRNDINPTNAGKGDPIHLNTVRYIDAEHAANSLLFKEGDLLISMRDIDTLAVLDPKEEKIIWAMRGFWRAQHNPEPLPNGNIILFDNQGVMDEPRQSSVIEFNPLTNEIEWVYSGTKEHPMFSGVRSCQQVLPNNNVLITEFQNGRLFEVTRDGTIVWEYYNPVRHPDFETRIAGVHNGQRFNREDLTFLNETAQ